MRLTAGHFSAIAPSFGTLAAELEDIDIEEGVADHVITDPPYAENVDRDARRGKKTDTQLCEVMPLGFDPATTEKRRRWARKIAIATKRWAIVFSDHEGSTEWRRLLEAEGLVHHRFGLWVRTGSPEITPQKLRHSGAPKFQGNGPAQGHEVLVIHHKPGRTRWHNGGHAATYPCPVVPHAQRLHPTHKPTQLLVDIIRDFCDAGDRIFDPFSGSGTVMVAAKMLGMPGGVAVDRDPKFAQLATGRARAASRNPHWQMKG